MASGRSDELAGVAGPVRAELDAANAARERGLAACRRVVRACGRSIRAVHRGAAADAGRLAAEASEALREAQEALRPYPMVAGAGFLHDAEKEYAEALLTAAFVDRAPLPGHDAVGVGASAWLCGLAEAASELRRHLLDRLRAGDHDQAEELLAVMEDAYDLLVTVDLPDALTGGLRRSTDALRAVLERTRGDLTTSVLQARLQRALERGVGPGGLP